MKLRYILWFPGYALLWMLFLLPQEWGLVRNVARTSRQWRYRDVLAPLYSLIFYGGLVLFAQDVGLGNFVGFLRGFFSGLFSSTANGGS